MPRSHDEEEAAAQAVQRVLGGTWVLHDTGSRARQVDVLHELDDGQRVALEVTSFGTHEQSKTRDAIQKRTEGRGGFAGASLASMWQILVATETRVSTLREPEIEEVLRDFETRGLESVSSRGAHPVYGDPDARNLARLGIEAAVLWNRSPPSGAPRILIGQSYGVVGKHTSLPAALRVVLSCTDNQRKLAAVEADTRHLYVHIHDKAAADGLRGVWVLPPCPEDPEGVIDAIWLFAPWASSAYLHRVVPGTNGWAHFLMATGEPVRENEALAVGWRR